MKSLTIGVLMAAVLAPLSAVAATPEIPNQFYGTVSYDSGATPAGLTVRALVGGATVATSKTQSDGHYGVMPNLFMVPDQTDGATIVFTVNGAPARETAPFANGVLTRLNLTVPGAAPSSSATGGGGSGSTPSSGSGGSVSGGSGGGPAASPTSASVPSTETSLTEVQKVFDTNKDNQINVLDFNALMVHWGEQGTGVIADFDGNGVVDVFDFNSLMVHWTA